MIALKYDSYLYLSLRVVVDNDSKDKSSHCTILILHSVVREYLNEVLVASIFHQVTLARLRERQRQKDIFQVNFFDINKLTGSTARIFAQMKTRIGCSSLNLLPSSLST